MLFLQKKYSIAQKECRQCLKNKKIIMVGICRFCEKKCNLIKAHIIPRVFFMDLYTESKDKRPLVMVGMGVSTPRPIGSFDQEILCEKCDYEFGEYDGYAKAIFFKKELRPHSESENIYVIEDVDEQRIQLFFLSLLWRSSISRLEEFRDISLGPLEQELRVILRRKIIPQNNPFRIVLMKYDSGSLPPQILNNIMLPTRSKISGINAVIFYLPGGFECIVKVDHREFSPEIQMVEINKNSPLLILKMGAVKNSIRFEALVKSVGSIRSGQFKKD